MKKISFLSFKYNFSCLLFFLSGSSIANLNSLDLPKNIYIYVCVRQSKWEGIGGSVCKTKMRKKLLLTISLFCFFLHKYCCKYIKKISILSGKHHFCPSIKFWIKKASRTFIVPPTLHFSFFFSSTRIYPDTFFAKVVGNNPSLVPRNIGANLLPFSLHSCLSWKSLLIVLRLRLSKDTE